MNKKIFGVVIVACLLTLVFVPTMNAVPKDINRDNLKLINEETNGWTAIGCRFYVDGIEDIVWPTIVGWVIIFEGNISIQKAFVLIDYDTQEKTFFDSVSYFDYDGIIIMRGFFFKYSDRPGQMEGFAMYLELGNFNSSKIN